MPSLMASRISLSPTRYRPVAPVTAPNPAPQPPIVIQRSPVMISSLPGISTQSDGLTRQFYYGNLPMRRIMVP